MPAEETCGMKLSKCRGLAEIVIDKVGEAVVLVKQTIKDVQRLFYLPCL
jgi:hypothetical protein